MLPEHPAARVLGEDQLDLAVAMGPREPGAGPCFTVPVQRYSEPFMRPFVPSRRLTVEKAGQGVGKTEQGLRAVAPSGRAVLLTHRRSLAFDLQHRFNRLGPAQPAQHYLEGDLAGIRGNVVVVVNSLPKLNLSAYVGATVYIDEVTQLLDAIHSVIMDDRREEVVASLSALLRNAAWVAVADRDVEQHHVDLLTAWMGISSDEVVILQNEFVRSGVDAVWHEAEATWLAALTEAARQGRRVYVASDSRSEIEELARELRERGVRTLTVVADDGSVERAAIMADLNAAVASVDAVLVSPALFTGVDITDEGFDEVFVLATGCTTAHTSTDFLQAVHRVRRPRSHIHVWVAQRNSNPLADEAAIEAAMVPLPLITWRRAWDAEFKAVADAYRNYYVKSTARRNADINVLPVNLRQAFAGERTPGAGGADATGEVTGALRLLTRDHGAAVAEEREVVQRLRETATRMRDTSGGAQFIVILDESQMDPAEVVVRRYLWLNGCSWEDLEALIRHADPRLAEKEVENFELAFISPSVLAERVGRMAGTAVGISAGCSVRTGGPVARAVGCPRGNVRAVPGHLA